VEALRKTLTTPCILVYLPLPRPCEGFNLLTMKPTKISLLVTKATRDFENYKMYIECELEPDEPVQDAFVKAKKELALSFEQINPAPKAKATSEKKMLDINTPELERVCNQLKTKSVTMETVQAHYVLTIDAINYIKDNRLWN